MSGDFLPFNFLGLPDEFSSYSSSKFAVLPVPYEQTTSFKPGTKDGPLAILNASRQVEWFDEELKKEFIQAGIHTATEMFPTALGPEQMNQKIYVASQRLLKDKKFVIMLGGEHSITYGCVRAHLEKFPQLSVLQLDAHSDLRDTYQENKFSHACAMRRVWELCPVVGYGIRNISLEEYRWVQKKRVKLFYATEVKRKAAVSEVVDRLTNDVYITIDLDFFDPAVVPAVGTPEPGGFFWGETLDLLRKVIENKKVVGFDVVELSPVPNQVASEFLAAKLIYKLIGYIVSKKS
ncbi:MAG: agmatinase [candidate division Zixibacteria bacterium RBG_16_50_21]|nr:MAG: agmatinase [candidate division Zixibacteria bacterium RBG_16_50_21]